MNKVPRLGVIPRYAEDEREMYWMEVPGLNVVHTVNAWEEDGGRRIVVVASNVLSIEKALEDADSIKIEKITIDVNARKMVGRHPVSATNLDFGVINTCYTGKKTRFVRVSFLNRELCFSYNDFTTLSKFRIIDFISTGII